MKRLCILLVAGFFFQILSAQVTELEKTIKDTTFVSKTDTIKKWEKGGIVNLSLSQASFSNWAAGGENSYTLTGLVSLFGNYTGKHTSWDNTLDLAYGLQQQGGRMMKTDDKIDFSSKFGKAATKKWFYAGLLNFKTQMTAGYDYPNDSTPISNFFAPAYVVGAFGMDYKPASSLSLFIAPVTGKLTIVADKTLADAGAYGVEMGEMTKEEFGGYVKCVFKKEFMKKTVSVFSKLELFSNYVESPENIDVNWETLIGLKVNKYISATISTQLMYDDDVKIPVDNNNDGIMDGKGSRIQFKEVIGIGFAYKF